MIRWWIDLWDRRETPEILALVRIGVGLVLLADFLVTARLGLVVPLMAGAEAGGLSTASAANVEWVRWVGQDADSAWLLWSGLVLSSTALTLGFSTRLSALLLTLLSAQWALVLPDADRGIDLLLRNVLLVLAFSSAGATWSVDAWIRTGSPAGDGRPVPAWPRYLLVLQVVTVYFTAGVQKYGQHWWPWGGWSGLYVILQDWAVAAYPFEWLRQQPFYLSTQLATAVTMAFQWSYPLVLVHYFPPPGPPGRFRRAFERWRAHWVWIAVGVVFHLLLAATMELGIFPWGTLALYPAFVSPDELRALVSSPARTRRTSAG